MPRVARIAYWVDDGSVQYTSASFLVGPIIAFGVLGLLVLLLRWTFAHGNSLVARRAKPGEVEEYGLLVPVATPANYIEAEMVRRRLEDSGVRATLAQTLSGPRLMVFPKDLQRAQAIIDARLSLTLEN